MATTREKIFQAFLNNKSVCTDTRNVQTGNIYFALKGGQFNGNDFLQQAIDLGCAWVIGDEERIQHERFILVKDSLRALQELALDYRMSWTCPVLAITGSNGKTTTKELTRDVLAQKYKVSATRGNLNNHIGIPLTILETPEDTEIAIIEMGANHQNEIADYCQYARPTHGVITNVGKAHLEGFGGIEGVQKGKRELYDYLLQNKGVIFCNIEQAYMGEWRSIFSPIEYTVSDFRIISEHIGMEIEWISEKITFHCQMAGGYNLNNIAAALSIGKYFGVDASLAARAISAYIPQNMRSQIQRTKHNELIIDAYNANPTSLENALRNLADRQDTDKLAIVGAMKEMGEYTHAEHEKIVELIKELKLNALLVGEEFESVRGEFEWYANVEELILFLETKPISDKCILIKGSRGIRLEKVLPFL